MSFYKRIKVFIKGISRFGIDINYALDSGISLFGFNISFARCPYDERSAAALQHCISLNPGRVIDVGSGGGAHANRFYANGAVVKCIDFGTSIYARNSNLNSEIDIIHGDFISWENIEKFDLVWCSHVLEHQRNVGLFIEKLISICEPDGYIAITVPSPHRRLWGGHLTLWTPGLLAYNIVMAGIDLSSATLLYGYREHSIIFKPKIIQLPDDIVFDNGDLIKLSSYLPNGFSENSESWF